jgi:hypothetical protein
VNRSGVCVASHPLMRRTISVIATLAVLTLLAPLAHAAEIDSSLTFRDAFLPPGTPSVAMRSDETSVLWNPAGLGMSDTYYLGFAWKATYLGDDRKVTTHYFLTKAKGFGIGLMRDDYSEGVRNTTIFSLGPRVSNKFALGFTGKWKGGFNFDAGAIARLGSRASVGIVGRNLRDKDDVRRYYEAGIGLTVVRGRMSAFFDAIQEDSPWREATAYGGGILLYLEHGISVSSSYFDDGEGNGTIRASIRFLMSSRIIEGEYSQTSDDWETLSARIATKNP